MGHFQKFIRNYAQVAKPLTDLKRRYLRKIQRLKKSSRFLTLSEKNAYFRTHLIITKLKTGQFIVTTDASTKGIGAILSQIIYGKQKVIAHASRTLIPGERNYSVTQLELLSIIHHLVKFQHNLVGRKLKLHSDHKNIYRFLRGQRAYLHTGS